MRAPSKRTVRGCCLAVVVAVAMLPAAAYGGITTTGVTLSSGSTFVLAPTVSGSVVAWLEQVGATNELWVRRANGALKHVPAGTGIGSLQRPAIALGRYVVWSEFKPATGEQLWQYDSLLDTTPTALTTGPERNALPAASGPDIAWVRSSGGTYSLRQGHVGLGAITDAGTIETFGSPVDMLDLYGTELVYRGAGTLHDLVSRDILVGPVQTVAADPGVDPPLDPAVSNRWWAWDRIVSGDFHVFARNRESGAVVEPPAGGPATGSYPSLSDSNLAYAPTTGADTDARLWNITSDRVLVASNGGDARYTGISGRLVAYSQRTASTWGLKTTKFRVNTDRSGGSDRYAVASDAARASYPAGWAGVGTVVVASGEDKAAADPLAAAGLCWKYDAPLLLTKAASLPGSAATVLTEVKAANPGVKVLVVGGAGSVSEAVLTQMRAIVGSTSVERLLATGDRYALAAKIAERMRLGPGGRPFPADPVALVVNGADTAKFFDALAMSAVARASGNPILLVRATSVPAATAAALGSMGAQGVVVGGGTGTVSAATFAAVDGTDRWSGPDRYATARAIADGAIDNGYCIPGWVAVAATLPDGVSGGAMAGRPRGVLLVTRGTLLSAAAAAFTVDHFTDIWDCRVLGGTGSVSAAVVSALDTRLNP